MDPNTKPIYITGGTGGPGGSGEGAPGGDGGPGGKATLNINYNTPPPSVLDVLRPHVAWGALYDSDKRMEEHATICQPETRTKILNEIRSWADSRTTTPLCWLSGPAGTGKTTVAHTIAEEYDKRGQLAATFFFWRKTGDRDDIKKLVPTLAWQIATKVLSAQERMEEALGLKNKAWVPLPESSLEDQLSKLLVRGPITDVNSAVPTLIVIDGLDECASQGGIRRLINWLRTNKPPFRFLLTSRPELQIKAFFLPNGDGRSDAWSLSLTESRDDIRRYFVEELEKVWPRQLRVEDSGPSEWPLESHLNGLVENSEGLFIYAATAVLYIGGEGNAGERLKDVLKLHSGLDSLYRQVIGEARRWDHFNIVMGSLMYLRYPLAVDELSMVLLNINNCLKSPVIRSALSGCHSILIIPANSNTKIESYHASLRDFLTDESRSQMLFYAPSVSHAQLLVGCLGAITRAFNNGTLAPKYALVSWYYHAVLFLSVSHTSEGLGGLRDKEGEELVKKIDLKWVKSWMAEALGWAGVPYLIWQVPPEKGQGHSRHRLDSTPEVEIDIYF